MCLTHLANWVRWVGSFSFVPLVSRVERSERTGVIANWYYKGNKLL